MRISELSSQTGVPIATIKFYLRAKLLPEGIRTSATQAQYDESHVTRLRLIRALLGPAGLSVAAAQQVIQAIEKPPESLYELLGIAATAVAGPNVDDALRALDEAGFQLPEGALEMYLDHMRQIAQFDRFTDRRGALCPTVHGPDRAAHLGSASTGRTRSLRSPLRLTVRKIVQTGAVPRFPTLYTACTSCAARTSHSVGC